MGTQQILMVILSVILVGTAIAVGIQMFDKVGESQIQLSVSNELLRLKSMARAYYRTPIAMGGGGNGKDPNSTLPDYAKAVDLAQLVKYLDRSATQVSAGGLYRFNTELGQFDIQASGAVGNETVAIDCYPAGSNKIQTMRVTFNLGGSAATDSQITIGYKAGM